MVGEATRDHCDLDALKLEKCGRIFDIVKRGVHRRRNEGKSEGEQLLRRQGGQSSEKFVEAVSSITEEDASEGPISAKGIHCPRLLVCTRMLYL
ncbi:uncharacterized protein LOC143366074 isoform X2 [Andrena cerasifolii]